MVQQFVADDTITHTHPHMWVFHSHIHVHLVSQLKKVTSDVAMCDLLDSDDLAFRYECGLVQPTTVLSLKDSARFVTNTATHYSIVQCMTELEQLQRRVLDHQTCWTRLR